MIATILKKTLALAAVVGLSTVLTVYVLQGMFSAVATSSQAACPSGDVNGDLVVDLSDPVYLLQFLFGSGPAPVACAQPSSTEVLLWARGSTGPPNGVGYFLFDEGSEQHQVGHTAMQLPRSGALRGLRITRLAIHPADFTVTVVVNGVATNLTASTASVPAVDPGVSVPVTAGDTVSFQFIGPVGSVAGGIACCLLE